MTVSEVGLGLSENWYRDNDFELREGEPTAKERRALGAKWAGNLRHTRSFTSPVRFSLADKLEKCRPRRRCRLAACLQCHHAFQRCTYASAIGLLASLGPEVDGITINPPGLQRFRGTLDSLKLESAHRHLRRLLKDAGVSGVPLIGLLDLSYNIHASNEWRPVFQPHFALLLPSTEAHSMSRKLRAFFKEHSLGRAGQQPVKRPVRRNAINDVEWQGSYAFKCRPVQKTWFDAYSSKARPTEQWLQAQQQVETLLWFGDHPPESRLFMVGVRRYGQTLKLL